MQEEVEALYWSLALTDQLNLGSAIIKVETSLSTGWTPSPATKDLHAEQDFFKKTRKKSK